MGRIVLGLLVLFVLELVVLIKIGSAIGALTCISLMFLAMVVGAALVKFRAKALMEEVGKSHNVNIQLLWLPLAGFFFIFPGFISDIIAVLLLLPPVENLIVKHIKGVFKVNGQGFTYSRYSEGHTFDGEFTREEEHIRFRQIDDKDQDKDKKDSGSK